MCGIIHSVVGGHPLLILGVAEPTVIMYTFLYDFAKQRPELGHKLFLAWTGWWAYRFQFPPLWTWCLDLTFQLVLSYTDIDICLIIWFFRVCVWTAVLLFFLAILGACSIINRFTRVAGELFGLLIAMLFMQQAVKVSIFAVCFPSPCSFLLLTLTPH